MTESPPASLYLKYRPKIFREVVGQGHVTSVLSAEVRERRAANVYLFTGPRGTGKTSTARILAKALNCANLGRNGDPCSACSACREIAAGRSLDVREVDAASHNSVEDVRGIRTQAAMAAGLSARRVFILDEAHMLSTAAFTSLLRVLEEPTTRAIFVLATTEPAKLPPAVRSRCRRCDFRPVPTGDMVRLLQQVGDQEEYRHTKSGLEAIARQAEGSVRDALVLLEQAASLGAGRVDAVEIDQLAGGPGPGVALELARAVARRDAVGALSLVARLSRRGTALRPMTVDAVGFFRGAHLACHARELEAMADDPAETLEAWREIAEALGSAEISRISDLLGEALLRMRQGREERLMLEMSLLAAVHPEKAATPHQMLARIEKLEARAGVAAIGTHTPPPASPPPATPEPATAPPIQPPAPPPPATPEPATAPPIQPPAPPLPATPEPATAPPIQPPAPPLPATPEPATAPPIQPPAPPPTAEANVRGLDHLRTVWAEICSDARGMDGALLRPTRPVSLDNNRLEVECGSTFRQERLVERGAAARAAASVERRIGRAIRIDFVARDIEKPKSALSTTPLLPDDPDPPAPKDLNDAPGTESDVEKFFRTAGITIHKVVRKSR